MKGQDFTDDPGSGAGGGERVMPAGRGRLLPVLKAIAVAAIVCTIVFAGGFGWFATYIGNLVTPLNPKPADAIIVLTGGQSRLSAALDLLKSGKGKRLLISGVHPSADRDDIRAATGGDKTLFSCCVDIDHAALDTIGNAEESAKWVGDHAYGSVIIVTNNYHMPRSLLEMRRYLGGAELEPYPVVNTRLDNGEWMTKPEAVRVLFTEYTKYLAALVRGVLPVGGPAQTVEMVNASATATD